MAQVKIHGLRRVLDPIKDSLSDVVHECIVEALQFPRDKKAHRFYLFEDGEMSHPTTATDRYIIIELLMIEGRSIETKKGLIRLLYARLQSDLNFAATDVEICILDNPAYNWGFRGMPGDEIKLSYKVTI